MCVYEHNCLLCSILSGSYDNKVYIWCDGEQVTVMQGHSKPVTDVKWVSDVIFLTASQDQGIFLWEVSSEWFVCNYVVYCIVSGRRMISALI